MQIVEERIHTAQYEIYNILQRNTHAAKYFYVSELDLDK